MVSHTHPALLRQFAYKGKYTHIKTTQMHTYIRTYTCMYTYCPVSVQQRAFNMLAMVVDRVCYTVQEVSSCLVSADFDLTTHGKQYNIIRNGNC